MMKKPILLICFVISVLNLYAQELPKFLSGTWQIENSEVYEHWDLLNPSLMKGVAYELHDGKIKVHEYMEIRDEFGQINLAANVLSQNNGQAILFGLTVDGSRYIYENPDHDFPKKVIYDKLSDDLVEITVSGDGNKRFNYRIRRVDHASIVHKNDTDNPLFEERLFKRYGGDDYGMKSYKFILLKSGNFQSSDKDLVNKKFKGHLSNIERLVDEGVMVLAGPLGENPHAYRGIFIIEAESDEEVDQIMKSDPAIDVGLLDYEVIDWYGSAALPAYLQIAQQIWKVKP